MNKTLAIVAISVSCAFAQPQAGFARGRGGAPRGGGGESSSREGSYSGSHYSGSHEEGHSDGNYSGSRQGSYSGAEYSGSHDSAHTNGSYSGSRQGSYHGADYTGSHQANYGGTAERGGAYGASGYHAGGAEYGAAGYHGAYGATATGVHTTSVHAALPTDGFAAAGSVTGTRTVTGVGTAHMTQPISGAYAAARGTAVNNSFDHPGMFGNDWYGAHPGAWQATAWPAGRSWSAASWATVGAAIGLGAAVQPISYNYGTNVTYQGDQVFNDGQPIASADDYYQQAASLAQAAAPVDADDAGWTSLGTFGLVRHDESDPTYVIQLAVNSSGAVAGNYCDMLTDHNLPVQGSVDPMTQKLAWTVGKNTKVVGEVGLYNLTTQSEAPALIHIGKDKTQQWLLVRLNAPASGS